MKSSRHSPQAGARRCVAHSRRVAHDSLESPRSSPLVVLLAWPPLAHSPSSLLTPWCMSLHASSGSGPAQQY
eukprot:15437169-Alexandrium_andersonii.AAC.1